MLHDPWGNAFVYRNCAMDYPANRTDPTARNKTGFDLHSFGPNGRDEQGGGDDLSNWEIDR